MREAAGGFFLSSSPPLSRPPFFLSPSAFCYLSIVCTFIESFPLTASGDPWEERIEKLLPHSCTVRDAKEERRAETARPPFALVLSLFGRGPFRPPKSLFLLTAFVFLWLLLAEQRKNKERRTCFTGEAPAFALSLSLGKNGVHTV